MARTNKYASINFNEIFDKKKSNNKPSSTSSSSTPTATNNPQKSPLSSARNHGGMLVLTRPSPTKPQTHHHEQPHHAQPISPKPNSDQPQFIESNSISLRPLGRTGLSPISSSSTSPSFSLERERETLPLSIMPPKPEPFVPPHLRPGFVGKEDKFGLDGQSHQRFRQQGSPPSRYGEDGRPKSGGYERMRRGGGDSDVFEMNRPRSGGNGLS